MASHRAIHRPGHAPRRSALAWRGRTAAVLYLALTAGSNRAFGLAELWANRGVRRA